MPADDEKRAAASSAAGPTPAEPTPHLEARALVSEALERVEAMNPIGDAASESVLWNQLGMALFHRAPESYRSCRAYALTYVGLLPLLDAPAEN